MVPTTRNFEEDDLFVRDPEAAEAVPRPTPKRRYRKKKQHRVQAGKKDMSSLD